MKSRYLFSFFALIVLLVFSFVSLKQSASWSESLEEITAPTRQSLAGLELEDNKPSPEPLTHPQGQVSPTENRSSPLAGASTTEPQKRFPGFKTVAKVGSTGDDGEREDWTLARTSLPDLPLISIGQKRKENGTLISQVEVVADHFLAWKLNPHPRCHPGGYAAEKQIPISPPPGRDRGKTEMKLA
ncbi:MAG: hypothetical protein GVY36_19380 [Verrucomicrobia bacterium]|jgi:hypothetical protein|nr:hypothetical protein [Verrucomicrobiota bacterium]